MKKLNKLFAAIMELVDDENLPDWSENVHPAILAAIKFNGYGYSDNLTEEVTSHYFNAYKVSQFRFHDFVWNYLYLSEEQEKSKELDQEKYE